MLSGEAAIAIWNDITDAGRAEFYAWHLHEHMPERAGISGFRRGRRYIACDGATRPEFFTLYEADTIGVLQGSDYVSRLNAPTPWTRRATAEFRNTSRAVARVLASVGPGAGGIALTVRFDAGRDRTTTLADLLRHAASAPRVTGAHLCAADDQASAQRTAESSGRTDLQAPPAWFAMVEATDADAVAALLPEPELRAAGATGTMARGLYRLEYTRTKTAFAAG
ncbi:MAG: hypothetical protein JOZ05_11535 [Acetobacteraceae bacterium]|nr:hypothetical protein [Acetobacteraceae bacterium]